MNPQTLYNEQFIELVKEGNKEKLAAIVLPYTRNKLYEASFTEKILPPTDISNSDLDKQEDPELLVKYIDREPDTAPAVVIPYNVVPPRLTFVGTRYPVYFGRIATPLYEKDIDKLRGYTYDIKAAIFNISTMMIAHKIDKVFIETVEKVITLANSSNNFGLNCDFEITINQLDREGITAIVQAMEKHEIPFGPFQKEEGQTSPGVILANNVTIASLLTLNRTEIGGDLAQTTLVTGQLPQTLAGIRWVATMKRDLVPDGVCYVFTSPEFLGVYLRLQPLTVFMETKAFFLYFMQWIQLGISIGNVRGILKVNVNSLRGGGS